jgi:hypothetical protein
MGMGCCVQVAENRSLYGANGTVFLFSEKGFAA